MLVTEGPKYGYFPNPSKTWLILKKQVLEEANATQENKLPLKVDLTSVLRWVQAAMSSHI